MWEAGKWRGDIWGINQDHGELPLRVRAQHLLCSLLSEQSDNDNMHALMLEHVAVLL